MALVERHHMDAPRDGVLVVALEGWVDAGFSAASATATLLESIETRPIATFSSDELVDHRARRPRLRIDDGVRGAITFVEPALLGGTDRLGSGVLVLVGPEPDYRWRAFSSEVTSLAVELGVRLVVGLGAFPTGAAHTRPVRLTATASDPELAHKIGFIPGSLDVPAGIGEVIGEQCSKAGIPSVGLWARIPHYVSAMPFPAGAVALLEGLASLSGLIVDLDELRRSAEETRRRVDELIAESSEHTEMVRQLEAQADASEEQGRGALELNEVAIPSGEEIAAELERYLRGET
jgi:hypothetical protein